MWHPRPAGVPARPYMGLDKTGEQEILMPSENASALKTINRIEQISRTDFLKRATGFLNRYLTVYESVLSSFHFLSQYSNSITPRFSRTSRKLTAHKP
ncbi:hypothetical protein AB2F98_01560 [Escherichia coli]